MMPTDRLSTAPPPPGRVVRLVIGALALGGLAVMWSLPGVRQAVVDGGIPFILGLARVPGAPVLMVLVYLAAGFVSFPVTILSPITGFLFGPVLGPAVSLTGIVVTASVLYAVGARLGAAAVEGVGGAVYRAAASRLSERSIVAVAIIRNVPFIPFTVTNLAGGACRLPFGRYLVGTIVGMAPATTVLNVLGHRVGRAVVEPGVSELLLLVGAMTFAVGLAWVLERWAARAAPRP